MRAAVLVLALVLVGCAHGTTAGQVTATVAKVGVDLVTCAPASYEQFKNAAQFGGANGVNWVGAILETLECASSVYHDVMAQLGLAALQLDDDDAGGYLLAQAGDEVPTDKGWSKRAIKRLARAKKIADRLQAPAPKGDQ
jgi:hypothetical protein